MTSKSGFTLFETLIAVSVLSVFFTAVVFILQNVLENIGQSRVRSTALTLAQEKMELVRNLPYASVGTVGGIPTGTIQPKETVTVNGLPFSVTTSIIFIDDPYDAVAPSDSINTDYKKVRIEITWGGMYPSRFPLALVSLVAPRDKETISGGGTLSVTVFNSQSQPVPNAQVTIDNTKVTPNIHMTTLSGSDGKVILPGAPPCTACYKISVTKQSYSTDRTYTTAEVANPIQPDATVIEGNMTQVSFSIDEISSLTVMAYTLTNTPYPYVQFTLRGSKIIGYDVNDNPVPKYTFQTNTGAYIVSIPNLETDIYSLDLNPGFILAGSNPILPIAVTPKSSVSLSMKIASGITSSLLVTVRNPGNSPLASASALLTDQSGGQPVLKYTAATGSADFGQVFFGNIPAAQYILQINLPGYQEASDSVTVTGNNAEHIYLSPI